MSTQNDSGVLTAILTAAAKIYQRLVMDANEAFGIADKTVLGDAVAQSTGAIGDAVAANKITPSKTQKFIASEAMATLNVLVFAADDGEVSLLPGAAATYFVVGKLRSTASGAGSVVEVLTGVGADTVVVT